MKTREYKVSERLAGAGEIKISRKPPSFALENESMKIIGWF